MKMRFLPALLLLAAVPALAQVETPRPSPSASVKQTVGLTDVTIDYSRPSIRGREIFGGLVPWDQVWRTGANEATRFEVSRDVMINGQPLPKGAYSLHTIPGQSEWTLIFNSGALDGGYSYDAAKDVLRVKATPRASGHAHEMLTFAFPRVEPDSAEIVLEWARVAVPMTLEVDTEAHVLASIQSTLGWGTPFQAANWAYQNEVRTEEALGWIDRSIGIQQTFANLSLKSRLLARAGRTTEAIATAEQAIGVAKAAQNPPNTSALEQELATWRAR